MDWPGEGVAELPRYERKLCLVYLNGAIDLPGNDRDFFLFYYDPPSHRRMDWVFLVGLGLTIVICGVFISNAL